MRGEFVARRVEKDDHWFDAGETMDSMPFANEPDSAADDDDDELVRC